jgi:hypothetical protein
MKVNRPTDPLGGGAAEPLDPKALQKMVKGGQFQAALDQLAAQTEAQGDNATDPTRSALSDIANGANLANPDGAMAAVKEASKYMVRSRLREKYRDTPEGENVIEGLSEFISSEPSLRGKFLSLLNKLKEY